MKTLTITILLKLLHFDFLLHVTLIGYANIDDTHDYLALNRNALTTRGAVKFQLNIVDLGSFAREPWPCRDALACLPRGANIRLSDVSEELLVQIGHSCRQKLRIRSFVALFYFGIVCQKPSAAKT